MRPAAPSTARYKLKTLLPGVLPTRTRDAEKRAPLKATFLLPASFARFSLDRPAVDVLRVHNTSLPAAPFALINLVRVFNGSRMGKWVVRQKGASDQIEHQAFRGLNGMVRPLQVRTATCQRAPFLETPVFFTAAFFLQLAPYLIICRARTSRSNLKYCTRSDRVIKN